MVKRFSLSHPYIYKQDLSPISIKICARVKISPREQPQSKELRLARFTLKYDEGYSPLPKPPTVCICEKYFYPLFYIYYIRILQKYQFFTGEKIFKRKEHLRRDNCKLANILLFPTLLFRLGDQQEKALL